MWLQCIVFWGGERADENATVDENAKRSQAGALCEPAAAPANARPAPCPRRCLLRPPKTFQDTKALQDHVQERHPKTQLSRARVAVCNLISTSRLALEQKKIWSTISLLIAATGFWQSRFLRSAADPDAAAFDDTFSFHLHFNFILRG